MLGNIIGDNCRYCLCNRCEIKSSCGIMNGDTEEYCESECLGENSARTQCSEFERKRNGGRHNV